jgi:hypothetical protein
MRQVPAIGKMPQQKNSSRSEIYSQVVVLMFVDCLEVVDVGDFFASFAQ